MGEHRLIHPDEFGELVGRKRKLTFGLEACIYESQKDVKYQYTVVVSKENLEGNKTVEPILGYHTRGFEALEHAKAFILGIRGGIDVCQNQTKE